MNVNDLNISKKQIIKIACIGDSITDGGTFTDKATGSYPAQLEKMLGNGYKVFNYGVSGTTLLKKGDFTYWNCDAHKESLQGNFDIIIIMLGTNDSKPQNWIHKAEFVDDYIEMISQYRNLSSKPGIFIATSPKVYGPPDSGNFDITDLIVTGEVVPLQKEIGLKANAPVIDVNGQTSYIPDYFPDFVHANEQGLAIIARTVYKALAKTTV